MRQLNRKLSRAARGKGGGYELVLHIRYGSRRNIKYYI